MTQILSFLNMFKTINANKNGFRILNLATTNK